jgi:hypothetical protein
MPIHLDKIEAPEGLEGNVLVNFKEQLSYLMETILANQCNIEREKKIFMESVEPIGPTREALIAVFKDIMDIDKVNHFNAKNVSKI